MNLFDAVHVYPHVEIPRHNKCSNGCLFALKKHQESHYQVFKPKPKGQFVVNTYHIICSGNFKEEQLASQTCWLH